MGLCLSELIFRGKIWIYGVRNSRFCKLLLGVGAMQLQYIL
jgi:hypothetical protein